LAIIRIDAGETPAAKLGDSSRVRPGHWSFTVGNPFGLADSDGTTSFAVGNVTALGKSLSPELDPTDTRYYGDLIQTSSSINPGNSGGPLFNIDGEVVGICTAMLSRSGVNEGLGFAVPISRRNRQIIDTLLSGQPVRYGYLGVKVGAPTETQRRQAGAPGTGGAYITEIIEPAGAAARAGLRPADLVVEFDGVPIANSDQLVRLVGETPVATEVELAYYRAGKRHQAKVRLAERPLSTASLDPRPASRPPTQRWRHTLLGEPTDFLLSAHGLTRADAGLVVVDIVQSGREYKAGLRTGAVIMKYNDRRVRTIEEFLQIDRTVKRAVRLTLDDGTVVRFTK
jgi:serine protease Do